MPAYSLAALQERRSTTRVLFLRNEGETIQFLSTSYETDYACAEMIFSLPPGQKPPMMHSHTQQQEHIVLSGSMLLRLADGTRILNEAETCTIDKGCVHTFGNASETEPLIVKVAFERAMNIEWYFTQMACAAIRNGGGWKYVPWLEAATIQYAVRREFRFAGIPFWTQDLAFGTLTLLAKLTGAVKNIRPLSLYKAYVK